MLHTIPLTLLFAFQPQTCQQLESVYSNAGCCEDTSVPLPNMCEISRSLRLNSQLLGEIRWPNPLDANSTATNYVEYDMTSNTLEFVSKSVSGPLVTSNGFYYTPEDGMFVSPLLHPPTTISGYGISFNQTRFIPTITGTIIGAQFQQFIVEVPSQYANFITLNAWNTVGIALA